MNFFLTTISLVIILWMGLVGSVDVGGATMLNVALIDVFVSSFNSQPLTPSCVNGAWQVNASYTLTTTITTNGMTWTGPPSVNNGVVKAKFAASFSVNSRPAPVTVLSAQGVNTSITMTAANMWTFQPLAESVQMATIRLAVTPACSPTTPLPNITTAFASPSTIVVPGGNGIPSIGPTGGRVVNQLPIMNNGGVHLNNNPPVPAGASCSLLVPSDPLSAVGLATPYQLSGCSQTSATATFVQAVILDMASGALQAYHPLVVNQGSTPAVAPKLPVLPAQSMVALWFGTNAGSLTLVGTGYPQDSLTQGRCENTYGRFTECNALGFFIGAFQLVASGKLVIPPLGVDNVGKPCPTTHDFAIASQSPSQGTTTTYLSSSMGIAQDTPDNRELMWGYSVLDNIGDQRILSLVQPLIGCVPWRIPDLTDASASSVSTIATNELQALRQLAPLATVPSNDPMVQDRGQPNLSKLNLLRSMLFESQVASLDAAEVSPTAYCMNLMNVGAPRLLSWLPNLIAAPAPNFAGPIAGGTVTVTAKSMAGYLLLRYNAAVGPFLLNCPPVMAAQGVILDPDNFQSSLQIFNVDPSGTLVLPTTFNVDGTFADNMTWAQAVGLPKRNPLVEPTISAPSLSSSPSPSPLSSTQSPSSPVPSQAIATATVTSAASTSSSTTPQPSVITSTSDSLSASTRMGTGVMMMMMMMMMMVAVIAIALAAGVGWRVFANYCRGRFKFLPISKQIHSKPINRDVKLDELSVAVTSEGFDA